MSVPTNDWNIVVEDHDDDNDQDDRDGNDASNVFAAKSCRRINIHNLSSSGFMFHPVGNIHRVFLYLYQGMI